MRPQNSSYDSSDWSVADLAHRLGISKRTIHNRLSLRPESLPKADRYPGCRNLHFKDENVRTWLGEEVA